MQAGQALNIPDTLQDPAYSGRSLEDIGVRALLGVPLLRDGTATGVITVGRLSARAFTDREIALVSTFAHEAVIAIENARLLEELRQRSADLSEALEQQTATAEVLRVISSSPGELEPVFNSMLENATRICEANFGIMYLYDDDFWRPVALLSVPPKFAEWLLAEPRRWVPKPVLGASLDRNNWCTLPMSKPSGSTPSALTLRASHLSNSPALAPSSRSRCSRKIN